MQLSGFNGSAVTLSVPTSENQLWCKISGEHRVY